MAVEQALRVVPDWVLPDHQQVVDYHRMAHALGHDAGWPAGRGQAAAVDWVTGGRVSPVTRRAERASPVMVRAESWAALCRAANDSEPTPQDWDRLGVSPWRSRELDRDVAYGAWRALAWLLGVRPDLPFEVPVRAADGSLPPGSQTYTTRARPGDPSWERTARVHRERNTADARRWYDHIRSRIIATYDAPGRSTSNRVAS